MKTKYIILSLAAVSLLAAGCNKQAAVQNSEQTKTTAEITQNKPDDAMMKDTKQMDGMEGVLMKDGKTLSIWKGNELSMLEKDVTLNDGSKVTINGKVISKDGKEIMLKNGEMISMDGKISIASKEMMMAKVMMEGSMSDQTKDKMMEKDTMVKTDAMMAKHGSYLDYSTQAVADAQKAGNKVVLFFHAAWCPYCKAADAAFKANLDKIPSGITVLKTDYDSNTELKTKYGVTYQHTFVQIDNNGNLVTKWVSGDIDLLKQSIK
jgi:thiol-disulfide isomerase/thioredoxin